jgi:formylglycine-generating enzyme required for sulfatase activity
LNGLLEALSTPFPKEPSDKDWRALWLAGEILLLYNRAIHKTSSCEERIVQNLRRLVEECALSPRERADAADVLDQFWQPNDLYTFIPIRRSTNDQTDQFLIGKYPVTNSQYERFLRASDFAKQEFWMDFPKFDENGALMEETWGKNGWEWLKENMGNDDAISPRDWEDAEFGKARPSVPVVAISWYEATAYCNWLLSHWNELEEGKQGLPKPKLIRLPTEQEWSQAAGGDQDKERYAWDRGKATTELSQILQCTNIYESEIGRTTPVWMYPLGVSLHGVMDMTGNTWEWMANYFEDDHNWLALRGGSWFFGPDLALVSNRSGDSPDHGDRYIGFRVCLSS